MKTATDFLDKNFEDLKHNKLPEYERAIEAIRLYKESLVGHFIIKYEGS